MLTRPFESELVRLIADRDYVELARRYPGAFKSGDTRKRRPRADGYRTQPPRRAHAPRAKPIPPPLSVHFTERGFNRLRAEMSALRDGYEIAGGVYGWATPDRLVVDHASGLPLGVITDRGPRHIRVNPDQFVAIARNLNLQWLGDWHLHPGGSAQPSEIDLGAWDARRHRAAVDAYVGAIVVERGSKPEIRAWVVHRDSSTGRATVQVGEPQPTWRL